MNKYLRFSTDVEWALGMQISGAHVTTGYQREDMGHTAPGCWVSVPGAAPAPVMSPGVRDWWRSVCGHTVDRVLEICPVCGELRS